MSKEFSPTASESEATKATRLHNPANPTSPHNPSPPHKTLPLAVSSPQQKRVAPQPDGEDTNGAKRSRAPTILDGEVKQEHFEPREEAGQGGQGAGALVAVVQSMEQPQINNIRMLMSLLHCHACVGPLKPPIFKCESDHFVCGACRGSHAKACAGAYVRCDDLDKVVRGVTVACAHETYGCTSWVVYYEALDHHRSCRFAPCFCPAPRCERSTSPAKLTEHFSSHHGWTVTEVDYATPTPCKLASPEDKLVLVGKADGSVFLMSPCALGAGTVVSSLVCVRVCGDAAAGVPQYTCSLWAEVQGRQLTLSSVVASSDMAGGFTADNQGIFLPVPSPPLMIRIDKVGVSAARSRSRSSTPPSSLRRRMQQ